MDKKCKDHLSNNIYTRRKLFMKILAVNAGSSSLKVQLLEMPQETLIAKAQVERIGLENAVVTVKYGFDQNEKGIVWEVRDAVIKSHPDAVKAIMDKFTEFDIIACVDDIKGVGHRIVQGGEYFSKAEVVTDYVSEKVLELAELAPHHNKAEHDGYVAFKQIIPNAVHTMVFDTAFHSTMPPKAFMYGVPYEAYTEWQVRKYGFHGTSHKYVSGEARKYLGRDDVKIVTCHLGNGSSIAAVKDGKCVDTSMGFTPLEGLVMGTRSGDIDPAAIEYIMDKSGMDIHQTLNYLNKKSGVLGISGVSSDFRDLSAASKEGNERATLALDMFAYRVQKYIGSYAAAMGGIDCIVFTGGIGENDKKMRERIMQGMEFLGANFSSKLNEEAPRGKIAEISEGGKVKVLVIPTNEELVIARETLELL